VVITIELAVLLAALSILALVFNAFRQILNVAIALERDFSKITLNLQRIAIRLTNVERYLERRTEFTGAGLDTGLDDEP